MSKEDLIEVQGTVRELLQESVDRIGWMFVLWWQAARKTGEYSQDPLALRTAFLQRLRHRIEHNDLGRADGHRVGLPALMQDLEVLALDLFLQHEELKRRLLPLARAIEAAPRVHRDEPTWRGRRGGASSSRSSD